MEKYPPDGEKEEGIITLPQFCLVAMVGVTGSGKTTFCRRHFQPIEVLVSDHFRELVSNDENSLEASQDAFDVIHIVAGKRLSRRLFTVIDATSIKDFARRGILDIAAEYEAPSAAIILNVPEDVCIERTLRRSDRPFGAKVVKEHFMDFHRTLGSIYNEGFSYIYLLDGVDAIDRAQVQIEENASASDEMPFAPAHDKNLEVDVGEIVNEITTE
jgi:predicted kinase